jgi:RHS repeat-associated protein
MFSRRPAASSVPAPVSASVRKCAASCSRSRRWRSAWPPAPRPPSPLSAPSTVNAGSNLTYTLSLTNSGPDALMMVSLGDALPSGTSFVSQTQTSGPAFTLSSTTGSTSDTISSMPSGTTAVFQIVAAVSSGTANNTVLYDMAYLMTSTSLTPASVESASASTTVSNSGGPPALTSLSPAAGTEGGAAFTLTVNGSNFANGTSVVEWNGTALSTTFDSSTQLQATVPAADLAEEATAAVTVVNSPGGTSNGQNFRITDALLTGSSTATATGGVEPATAATLANATFTDDNTGAPSSDFTITAANWGDGSTDTTGLTIAGSNGTYTVTGTHLYSEEGLYSFSLTVQDDGGQTATITGTANVRDLPLHDTSTAANASTTEGASTGTLTVATFTDDNPGDHPGDFTATIFWGDGTSSPGTVSYSNGSYAVSGSHTYADEGSCAVTVDVSDGGTALTGIGKTTVAVAEADALSPDASQPTLPVLREGIASGSIALATFDDTFGGATAGDFSVRIDWGDSSGLDSGTVTGGSGGPFTVHGQHTYAEEGSYTVQITLSDDGSGTATAALTRTLTVGDAALTDTSTQANPSATEGASTATLTVATFTDANPGDHHGDFIATIFWGDGLSSSGTVSYSNGTYTVTGSHSYAEEGPYAVTVDVSDYGGSTLTGIGKTTVTVSDAALTDTSTAANPSATEGTSTGTLTVATFTDANPGDHSGDFTATIFWGDGLNSTGTVSYSGGTYAVTGSHTYADEGSYAVTVNVSDDGGSTLTAIGKTTVTVTEADALSPDASQPNLPTLTEGAASGSIALAKFDDTFGGATAGDFTVSINWGDQSGTDTTTGTVSGNRGGPFTVNGQHTYAEEGSYTVQITLSDDGPGTATGTITRTLTVGDAALTDTSTQANASSTEGGSTATLTVATFTDANPGDHHGDFTATIFWGDDTSSTGTVSYSNGTYAVSGSHSYADEGSYAVTVDVSDDGGSTLTGSGKTTVTVAEADALSATMFGQPNLPTLTEGSASGSLALATFTDSFGGATASDFTVSIDWGDGSGLDTTTGTVSGSTGGPFTVSGQHTYADEGNYNVQITLSDDGSGTATATLTRPSTVNDAALTDTSTAANVSATEGTSTGTLTVATFTDANPGDHSGDFSATIFWGDSSSPGTVSYSNGTYFVTGSHSYTDEGSYAVSVFFVSDDGGSQLMGIGKTTVTVSDAALADTSTAANASATEGTSTGTLTVATFTDANPGDHSGDFMGTLIHWGDGMSGMGTVSYSNGTYAVTGSHSYADEGAFAVTVDVTDDGGSQLTGIGQSTVTVSDAALGGGGVNLNAVAGRSTGQVLLGTFSDANPNTSLADFQGSGGIRIDWGDGSGVTAGAVQPDPRGGFDVSGQHSYASPGDYQLLVTVADDGGATVTLPSTVSVAPWAAGLPQPYLQSFGEATADLNQGGLLLDQALDLVQSDSSRQQFAFALTYNSITAELPLVVEVTPTIPAGDAAPVSITGTLTLNGVAQPPVTVAVSNYVAGDSYLLDCAAPPAGTGLQNWSLAEQITLADGTVLDQGESGTAETGDWSTPAFGSGWGLSGLDQLVPVAGGVLWITGSGDARLFTYQGSGPGPGTLLNPAGDFGTLVENNNGSFTYTAKDQTVEQFNALGLETSLVFPDGPAWSFSYDGQQRLTTVTAPDTGVSSFSYGNNGLLSAITEPGGRTRTLGDDSFGNVTGIVNVDGTSRSFTFDARHRLLSDAWSPWSSAFTYDATSGLLVGVNLGGVEPYTIVPVPLSSTSGVATVTDGLGHTTSDTIDQFGDLVQQTLPDGVTWSWTYAYPGLAASATDGRDLTTSYSYDSAGDLLEVFNPDGSTLQYQYDPVYHEVTQATDGDGKVTLYTYGQTLGTNGGDLLSETAGYGTPAQTTTTETWSDGLLQSSTDGDGNTTTDTYNNLRQQTAVSLANAAGTVLTTTAFTYDANGYQSNQTVSGGGSPPETTVTVDNGRGELLSQTNPAGDTTSSTYAPAGDTLTSTNGDGTTTTYTYNGADEEVSETVVNAQGTLLSSTQDSYDLAGNLSQSVNGDGHLTVDSYDSANHQTGSAVYASLAAYQAGAAAVTSWAQTLDGDGNVLTSTDGDGHYTVNTYDGVNRQTGSAVYASLAAYQQGAGPVTTWSKTFDGDGNVVTSTDGDFHYTVDSYDGVNNQTGSAVYASLTAYQQGAAAVTSWTQTFDKVGNVLTSTDGDGHYTVNSYDGAGNLLTTAVYASLAAYQQGAAALTSSTDTYDAFGNELTQTAGDGHYTVNTDDGDNRQTSSKVYASLAAYQQGAAPVTSSASTYDGDGNVLVSTEGDGNTTTDTYNGADQVLTQVVKDSSGTVVSSLTKTYDLDGNVLAQTDGDGNTTYYTYNGADQVLTQVVKNSAGAVVSSLTSTYDQAGNVATQTDGDGNTTSDTYDGANKVLTQVVKNSSGAVVTALAYSYDLAGNVATQTDGDGTTTSYTYDGDGHVLTQVVTDSGGNVVSSVTKTYDQAGNVATSTDGDGNTTSYTYNGANQVLTKVVKSPSGTVVTAVAYSYDQAGNVATVTDGDGNTTSYTYNGAGQVLTQVVKDSSGTVVASLTKTYDEDGNLLTTADGVGDVTFNVYDGNRLVSSTTGYGTSAAATTSYTYDEDGNVASETDPDGNTTSYTYNALGKVLTVTNALGTTTNTYDQAGNLLSTTDTLGRTKVYTYNGANQVLTSTWYNSDGTVNNLLVYCYDQAGNLTQASSFAGAYTMTYDGNRLLTYTTPSGLTLTYSYDLAGNVTSVQDAQGGLTTYAYNGAGQVTSKTFQNGTTQMRVDFSYDQAGNVLTETRYNDVAGTQLAGTTQYTYNGVNQVTSILQTAANGVVLGSFSYTYNLAGQVTAQTVNGVTTAYAYDATGQLIAAGGQDYNFDANGNPDSSGDSIGPDNELLSDGTWNYTYDGAGNLIQKVSSDASTVWTYGYDVANQMISAVEVVDGVTVLSIAYTYDVFGNRVAEMVMQGDSTTTTQYVYDASNTLYATADNSGTIQMWYIAGVQGPDTWLAQVDNTGSGNSAWLLDNYQGSITTVEAMGSGAFTQITYDAFGNTTNVAYYTVSGAPTTAVYAPAQGLLGFQGGQWDPFVQLFSFKARWESPEMQEWTTPDPSGLPTGPNPYEFAGNHPTNAIDPTGLEWIVTRDPHREKAEAHNTDVNDTYADLARMVGLDATEIDNWLTDYDGRNPNAPLGRKRTVYVPNLVIAYWGGEYHRWGKWWVRWDQEVEALQKSGFKVWDLWNRFADDAPMKKDEALRLMGNLTKKKELQGVLFWGHASTQTLGLGGTKARYKGFPDYYMLGYGEWGDKLQYRLGLGILFGCDSYAARPGGEYNVFSPNATFYGSEGTLNPFTKTLPRVKDIIENGGVQK